MFPARRINTLRCLPRQMIRSYAETAAPTPPPLLGKMRTDLKTAMKAKDTNRLNVLRAVLAEINNAGMANPPKPVKSDLDILKILMSMQKKQSASIAEFTKGNRQDLVDKEQAQIDILKDYASDVKSMSVEELEEIARELIAKQKESDKEMRLGDLIREMTAQTKGQGLKSDIAAVAKKALGGA